MFRDTIGKIGRPIQNLIYKIHDPLECNFLTKLRLSHIESLSSFLGTALEILALI